MESNSASEQKDADDFRSSTRSENAVGVGPGADRTTDGGAEGDNKFQKAIAAWRNIDLTNLIPTLDTTASDLVAHQRDALVERKELAQKTKDFRRLDDAGKLVEIKGLLKAYQTYIDLVTNQSKTVSSSFLQVYSSLSEAPDPYPLLEASVDSLVVADETLPKLEAENRNLQTTTSKLTSQLEEAENRLEQERKARITAEEDVETKVKGVEASWSAVLAEKQDNWEARERSLEEKAEHQERLLKELKASYEVSQRLDRGEQGEDGIGPSGATAVELEMVSSDLERANARLADVEARNEQLRLELAQSTTRKEADHAATSVEDDPTFVRLQSENASLLRKIDSVRLERDSQLRESENLLRSLRKEITALREDSQALKAKVSRWGDYEDVKRELEILKSIEFATGENEELQSSEDQALEGSSAEQSQSLNEKDQTQNLEQLLLARNKKLNNELTVLRVSHQDLANRLEQLQDDLSNTNMELERARNLNSTLENDLSRLQNETSTPHPAPSVTGSRYPSSSYYGRKGRISPTSSIISGIDPSAGSENARGGELGGGTGILPMITAQRDRFKKRNSELEAELSKSLQTISSLRSEVNSLQKDNLNLYEKTRYVSSYSRGQPASSASSYAQNPNPSMVKVSDSSSTLDRYYPAYESKISPFAAFRGRESARAFRKMTLPERVIFRITRMVLATRTSRNLFAFYCLALHLLILGMLYHMSTSEIERNVTHLADNAAEVAMAAAGAADTGAAPDDWQQEGFNDTG